MRSIDSGFVKVVLKGGVAFKQGSVSRTCSRGSGVLALAYVGNSGGYTYRPAPSTRGQQSGKIHVKIGRGEVGDWRCYCNIFRQKVIGSAGKIRVSSGVGDWGSEQQYGRQQA